MNKLKQPLLSRRFCLLLPLILLLISVTPSHHGRDSTALEPNQSTSTLYFHLQRTSDILSMKAELNDLTKEITFGKESDSLINDFHYLYNVLSNMSDHNTAFQKKLDALSQRVLAPFKQLINKSQQIIFIIEPEFIKFPLDLLRINDNYLFLQKPVLFGFQKLAGQNPDYLPSKESVGLIVRDSTADPEDGCISGKTLYKNSWYYNMTELNLEQLSKLTGIDFVLMSVHGIVNIEKTDSILFNDERLRPDFLNLYQPKFIYLDSCRLGVSYSFISNAMESGTIFYLGPIVSNDAGNSSTKTIQYFFQGIAGGNSFGDSLYQTRVRLYNEYKNRLSAKWLFWYCFPLRVYWLKESRS